MRVPEGTIHLLPLPLACNRVRLLTTHIAPRERPKRPFLQGQFQGCFRVRAMQEHDPVGLRNKKYKKITKLHNNQDLTMKI